MPGLDADHVAAHGCSATCATALRAALGAILAAAVDGRAFAALTGAAGAGKTTVLDRAAALLGRPPIQVIRASAGGEPLTSRRLLGQIAGADGESDPETVIEVALERLLMPAPPCRRTILMVDDAHLMERDALSYLQLTSGLQVGDAPGLQIVFAGRPEFWSLLDGDILLRQLRERICFRAVLDTPIAAGVSTVAPQSAAGSGLATLPAFAAPSGLMVLRPGRVRGGRYAMASGMAATLVIASMGSVARDAVQTSWPMIPAVLAATTARAAAPLITVAETTPPPPVAASAPPAPVAAASPAASAPPLPASTAKASAPEPASSAASPTTASPAPEVEPAKKAPAPPEPPSIVQDAQPPPPAAVANENAPAAPVPEIEPAKKAPTPPEPPSIVQDAQPPPPAAVANENAPAAPVPEIEPAKEAPAPPEPPSIVQDAQPPPPPAVANENAPAAPVPLAASQAQPAAPALPATAVTPPAPPLPASMPASMIASLLSHGDEMMRLGDIGAARLLFERAAEAGSGAAAIAMGKTQDPRFLAQIGAEGLAPDPQAAALWYRRAVSLGDHDADRLLGDLGNPSAP